MFNDTLSNIKEINQEEVTKEDIEEAKNQREERRKQAEEDAKAAEEKRLEDIALAEAEAKELEAA